MAEKTSEKFTLKGWSFLEFLKGRKKLLVTAVGAVAAYAITQNAALSAMIGAGTELLYAIFDYYIKE